MSKDCANEETLSNRAKTVYKDSRVCFPSQNRHAGDKNLTARRAHVQWPDSIDP